MSRLSVCRFATFVMSTVAGIVPVHIRDATAEPLSDTWQLTWRDEFDGEEVDAAKWDFDIGNGFYNHDAKQWVCGWGNGELQYYTREPSNAFVRGGMLHVRAIKESLHGFGYTSARLKTRQRDGSPLFNQKYGRFEFRAKLPIGKGVWPALWLLPQEEKYGPWPSSGEIDVMEARGQEPNKVMGALHYGSRWPANTHVSQEHVFPANVGIAGFHVYAMEWEPDQIRWFVNNHEYAAQSFWWSSSKSDGTNGVKPAGEADLNPWPAPFDQPFYLVMNVAIGGKFVGTPDKTTEFPAEMLVDYVRVYDKVGGYRHPMPRSKGKLPFAKP